MMYIAAIPLSLAVLCWFVAAVSWIRALGHLAEGVTIGAMIFAGVKAFDPQSFTPQGRVHQTRFLKAFVGFFVFLFISAAVGIAAEQLTR